jgi:hypothetical protein
MRKEEVQNESVESILPFGSRRGSTFETLQKFFVTRLVFDSPSGGE